MKGYSLLQFVTEGFRAIGKFHLIKISAFLTVVL